MEESEAGMHGQPFPRWRNRVCSKMRGGKVAALGTELGKFKCGLQEPRQLPGAWLASSRGKARAGPEHRLDHLPTTRGGNGDEMHLARHASRWYGVCHAHVNDEGLAEEEIEPSETRVQCALRRSYGAFLETEQWKGVCSSRA
jgi:hypothetical protein